MLSFAVTAYNETSAGRDYGRKLLDCIRPAQQHDAVDEIVVVDDGSEDFGRLEKLLAGEPKVRLHHNPTNRGVFGNKLEAVARSRGQWVITCDSDNLMHKAFIDKIVTMEKDPHTWYCPSFARTHFDYRRLVGQYTLATIGQMLARPMAECCMNTGNQTVFREGFMDLFGKYRGERADLIMPNWLKTPQSRRATRYWRDVFDACDSFIFNMEWLTAGHRLHVVASLEYDHYYAAGPEGNYMRAPVEKELLNERLVADLKQRSEQAAQTTV